MPSLQDALLNALNKPVQQPTLSATLNEWEQDDQPTTKEKPMANAQPIVNKTPGVPTFGVTNNVTRETFNFIRDHKGCSRAQVIDSLHARGFNANSVGSLIAQLALSNQISRENDKLMALIPEYRPIKVSELRAKRKPRKKDTLHEKRMEGLKKAWAARSAKAAAKKAEAATTAQRIIAKEEPKQKYQPKQAAGIAALSTTTPTPALPLIELTADKILDTLGVRQAKVLYAELKKIFEE